MSASLRLSLLALATSSLTACEDRQQTWSRSEIEAIAEDFADTSAADSDNGPRIYELEEKVTELESENDSLRSELDSQRAMIDELYENQRATADWVNEAHGL